MKKTLFYLSCLTCLVFLSGISAVSAQTIVSAPATLDGVLEVNSIDYTYNPETLQFTKTYTLTNISGETLQNPKLVNLFLWSGDISSSDWAVMPFDALSTYANVDQLATVANSDGFISWSATVTPNTISSTALFPDLPVQTVAQDVSYPYWNIPGFPTQWPNGHLAILSLQFNDVPNCNWIQNMPWIVYDLPDPNQAPVFLSEPRWPYGTWPKMSSDPANPNKPQSDHNLFFAFDDDGNCGGVAPQKSWMFRPVEVQAGEAVPLGDGSWTVAEPGWSYMYWVLITEPTMAEASGPGLFELKIAVQDCQGKVTDTEGFYGKRYYFEVQ